MASIFGEKNSEMIFVQNQITNQRIEHLGIFGNRMCIHRLTGVK